MYRNNVLPREQVGYYLLCEVLYQSNEKDRRGNITYYRVRVGNRALLRHVYYTHLTLDSCEGTYSEVHNEGG